MFLKPKKLIKGDKIGIVVPSSPIKNSFRNKGLNKIKEIGYVPVEANNILSNMDFRAKIANENINDIQKFLDNNEIKAIWAARGGYGSNYLLPFLSEIKIKEPKIIIGASDVSYLLWYIMDHFNMVVFYGPMVYSSLAEGKVDTDNLVKILEGDYNEIKVQGKILRAGVCKGIVTGGCLSNFVSLIGTDYLPEVDERILLLEDVNERPYKLDRMLWQIAESGVFKRIKGLLLGEFPFCFKDNIERKIFLLHVVEYLKGFDIPVIYNLSIGHSSNIHTLPFGVEIEINTTNFKGLIIREKGVI